jgi:hypothetical protein
MDKQLEKALSIIKDKQLERALSIVVAGYILSLGFYFIWCFYFFYERLNIENYLLVVVAVVFAITAVYFFPYLLISYIKLLQKVWTSFLLVSIISLLIFFLIPSVNSKIYHEFNLKRDKIIKTIKINKQLEGAKEKAHTDRDSSEIKINAKVDNTDLDSLGQEIIFKVQFISSDILLSINSSKLMGLKNVWVYEDDGLYKYTVGNKKDLKSAYVLQSELRRKGFVGAFVVAFKNGKRIPVREAIKLLN